MTIASSENLQRRLRHAVIDEAVIDLVGNEADADLVGRRDQSRAVRPESSSCRSDWPGWRSTRR